MLDEFDVLLNHPHLNNAEFFGSLRSLASLQPALSLLIAGRQSLSTLNTQTQEYNTATGSPYFNILREITLEPLADEQSKTLLKKAGERFNIEDRRFISKIAGTHPYLLQTAASALWEAYEDGETDPLQRREQAGQQLYNNAELTFNDTWRLWTPMTRMAVMTIALTQIPKLVKNNTFTQKRLLREMKDFTGQELRRLEKTGFITKDSGNPSGWRICPEVLLWWLADELTRAVRDEKSFNEWTQKQEWELTNAQKQQLSQTGQSIANNVIASGIFELIKLVVLG
ncbi:MAG: hypothetical protein DRR08_08570 [Candidatus Parabeggiatoa sp. nov. 2]|nr:MAG: hypothetical protein B6247_01970 [Beggiatoa sp. 4572_84]RKZ61512.1 MAG: hypothetical protein DRR08_08570 [Gammaproteobacteria bacterium]HEC84506.1 hypothetical protein [Thioploca sp.]